MTDARQPATDPSADQPAVPSRRGLIAWVALAPVAMLLAACDGDSDGRSSRRRRRRR